LLWLIPLLPLLGSATVGLVGLVKLRLTGRRFDRRAASFLALTFVGASFLLSVAGVYERFWIDHSEERYIENLFTWFEGGSLQLAGGRTARPEVPWGYQLDALSAIMIRVVTGVGFLIHVYSTGYMWDDPGYYRFFAYLTLFMFAMLTLVLANNFLVMF